jgi:hypothetical protein
MSKAQIWILLGIVAAGVCWSLWLSFNYYELAENRAWADCNHQPSARRIAANIAKLPDLLSKP